VRVAIDLAISVRIVIFGLIQTLIIVDAGRDAKQIESYEPEARRTKTMGLTYRWTFQECRRHLLHIVVMIRTMMHSDDATMIGVTVMEIVEVVEAERVVGVEKAVDKSTSTRIPCLTNIITHLTCKVYRQCLPHTSLR
jgi:hypothetical protein